MTVFFVDWELWQEMTFVLACCIAAVFLLGAARLWWTNRAMRRLEVLDEEKRAHISEMRHCGIHACQSDDIPFGVRALQSGLEVDGIWVSRPHLPELSPVASSATLLAGNMEGARWNGKVSELSSGEGQWQHHASESSTIDQVLRDKPQSRAPNSSEHGLDDTGISAGLDDRVNEQPRPSAGSEIRSYLPTGWHEAAQASNPHLLPLPSAQTQSKEHLPVPSTKASLSGTSHQYGAAIVHANKATRRPSEHFEILPAGSLGPRHELSDAIQRFDDEDARLPYFQPGPAKLRKKKTRKHGGSI